MMSMLRRVVLTPARSTVINLELAGIEAGG